MIMDETTQIIMLNYLQKTFPVKKLKDGRRFKRGIRTDEDMNLYLSPREETNKAFNYLSNDLANVFGVPQVEINLTVLKYLNLI